MLKTFDQALKWCLEDEGGNDDDEHDPGGRTSRGIIQREYDAWQHAHGRPNRDVWTATDDEVHEIYHAQYWKPRCDALPAGVDYLLFDMNVNMGPVEAAKLLQRGLGVADDGHIGAITMAAAQRANAITLVSAVGERKRAFYRSLRTFRYYGKGWLGRVDRVEKRALRLAVQGGSSEAA